MCAECRRAAQADIAQHLPLLVRQCTTPALKELFLMSVEDIGQFKPNRLFGEVAQPEIFLHALT
jgi:hypothetical protein